MPVVTPRGVFTPGAAPVISGRAGVGLTTAPTINLTPPGGQFFAVRAGTGPGGGRPGVLPGPVNQGFPRDREMEIEAQREARRQNYILRGGIQEGGPGSPAYERIRQQALAAWATPYAAGVIGTPAYNRRMGTPAKINPIKAPVYQEPNFGGADTKIYQGGWGGGGGGRGGYNDGLGLVNWRIGY